MRVPRSALVTLALAGTSFVPALVPAATLAESVRWRVECRPDLVPPRLEVTLEARGLDRSARDVSLLLPNWGEWIDVASDHLLEVECVPPAVADPEDPTRLSIDVSADWDGTLRAQYAIALTRIGTTAYERHGLLPALEPDERFVLAYTENTLLRPVVGGHGVTDGRTLELVPPDGWTVVSGWGGVTKGRQRTTLPTGAGNTLIAFGVETASGARGRGGSKVEVIQFGAGADVTGRVLDVAAALLPAYARSTGRTLDGPTRVVVTRAGWGGDRTDGVLCLRHREMTPEHVSSPGITTFLAHELFHHWLGGLLAVEDPGLVWFQEGFTEYLAHWHAAALGLVEREEFARKVLAWDAAMTANAEWPRVDFTAEGNAWRDGGAVEQVAYQGGALLAFALDVRLREAREAGLSTLIGDLLDGGGGATRERLEDWFAERGQSDFHDDVLSGGRRPDASALLAAAGFVERTREARLTDLGLRCDGDAPPVRVVEVEALGAAERAGVREGDVLTGWWPVRSDPPEIDPSVETRFRFGLASFDPDAGEIHLGVLRDGVDSTVSVTPRIAGGGRRRTLEPTAAAESFFRLRVRD